MADKDFIQSKVQTDAHVQASAATGASPLTEINREFEERATQERAQKMGMNYIDIEKVMVNTDHLRVLTAEEAFKALVMPFYRIGKKVRLALVHPTDPATQEIIRRLKGEGYSINVNLASAAGLERALEQYKKIQTTQPIKTENIIEESEIESYQREVENLTQLREKIGQVTAEEALNFINVGALKTGASDIHYQPEEKAISVRF
ncbi:MAG: hypothetical protein AAB802_05060, partial [Patescibacteria group bacterium]